MRQKRRAIYLTSHLTNGQHTININSFETKRAQNTKLNEGARKFDTLANYKRITRMQCCNKGTWSPTNCKFSIKVFRENFSAQENKWNENLRKAIIFTSRQVSSFFPSRVMSRSFPLYFLCTSRTCPFHFLNCLSHDCSSFLPTFKRKVWMNVSNHFHKMKRRR